MRLYRITTMRLQVITFFFFLFCALKNFFLGVCFFIVHYLSTYLHFWSQTVQFVLDNEVDTFMQFIIYSGQKGQNLI